MKINNIEVMRIGNAAAMLVFSVLYTFFRSRLDDIYPVLFIWVVAVIFVYIPDILNFSRYPEEEIKDGKKAFTIGGWLSLTYLLYNIFEDSVMVLLTIAFFIGFIASTAYYWKKGKKAKRLSHD